MVASEQPGSEELGRGRSLKLSLPGTPLMIHIPYTRLHLLKVPLPPLVPQA